MPDVLPVDLTELAAAADEAAAAIEKLRAVVARLTATQAPQTPRRGGRPATKPHVASPTGAALRTLYVSRGLSRYAFAKLVGLAQTTPIGWENNGKTPSACMVVKIAEAMQLDDATRAQLLALAGGAS